MSLWAIVPLKIVTSSKQRLAGVLTAKQRIQLTIAMAEDVLAILHDCKNIDHILLISDDAIAESLCLKVQAEWLRPAEQKGLNADLTFACDYAQQQGAKDCLILHADLPLLHCQALDHFIKQAQEKALTQGKPMLAVVPCKEGSGSNLVYAPLPFPVRFVYGKNSFPLFKQQAQEQGIDFVTLTLEDGDLDVDIPEDLNRLQHRLNTSDSSDAPATRYVLTHIITDTSY
ncbi:MAG: 2-phospho-L-lactate guanylyltransferase [Pseudomonadales bacterium]|nr:2-phospho-L-lactate guanylyltransferase [Pseudomonadales bacterium]